MTRDELLGRRWGAQNLTPTAAADPQTVVARLGVVQAQDPKMVLAAVARRSRGLTEAAVVAALDSGVVVRTHVLRPTWHLVAAADVRWMTALTADRIRAAGRSNQLSRGVTAAVLDRSLSVIEATLKAGPQTRDVLVEAFIDAGLAIDENRASHYLMNAEIALVACSGPRQGGKATYDLAVRRLPAAPEIPRSEALCRLAQRYVAGHGPAGERDFAWWSGLNLTDARRGLSAAEDRLRRADCDGLTVWYDPEVEPVKPPFLAWLPAYDEYLIAFADRSAAMDEADAARWVTKNGIFHPVVVHDGRVVARWKRPERPGGAIGVEWFHGAPEGADRALTEFSAWWRDFVRGDGGQA
jgi:hypothetical protein